MECGGFRARTQAAPAQMDDGPQPCCPVEEKWGMRNVGYVRGQRRGVVARMDSR